MPPTLAALVVAWRLRRIYTAHSQPLRLPSLGHGMFLSTAKQHYDHDIQRAKDLIAHAIALPDGNIKDDILRASWMMAVGACDAYFSDAYADLISRTLRAKDIEPAIHIPDRLNNLKIPVTAILRQGHDGWRWRMAARELIEEENVLSLEKIKKLFNHFFRKSHKILSTETIGDWIIHRQSKKRLFGVSSRSYRAMIGNTKHKAKIDALDKLSVLFEQIFQRRHDCIHNCDRPKIALQAISPGTCERRIQDINFLVERCHEALITEFPEYLRALGFRGTTRARVTN